MRNPEPGTFKPITKNFDVDQALLLARLASQHPNVDEFKEVAVQELPQATRSTRLGLANRLRRYFFETEKDHILHTPALQIWASSQVDEQVKRQLLYVYYLRALPLVWHAVHELVLPHSENRHVRDSEGEIPQEEWDTFLSRYLAPCADSTFIRTRNHLTAHLIKFGVLEAEPVPGEHLRKRFYVNPLQPQADVFWFALALEYRDHGWMSRTVEFLAEESWSRIAFCTPPTYVRWAMDEAEQVGLGYSDYYGAEKQFTWRTDDVPAVIADRLTGQAADAVGRNEATL